MATRTIAAGDAVYARYSSELQNPRSCDDQITELRQAVERRGGRFDQQLVFSCVFRCIRSAVPEASDQDSGDPIRNRSEATRTGAGQTVG